MKTKNQKKFQAPNKIKFQLIVSRVHFATTYFKLREKFSLLEGK